MRGSIAVLLCVLGLVMGLSMDSVQAQEPAPAAVAHPPEKGTEGVSTDPSELKTDLAIYSLAIFFLLMGGLATFAWKPIMEGLDKREHSLHEEVAAAERARHETEQLLKSHQQKLEGVQDEVRAIIAEARQSAEQVKEDIVATAKREAEAERARAVSDINLARDKALAELFDFMAENVSKATEQVVGRSLRSEDHDRLVRQTLSDLTRTLN